jgi:hypothetical protein
VHAGNHLPIVSSSVLYSENKPRVVLLLAWAFAKAIINKHVQFVHDGGTFVVPLPTVYRVDASNIAHFLAAGALGL